MLYTAETQAIHLSNAMLRFMIAHLEPQIEENQNGQAEKKIQIPKENEKNVICSQKMSKSMAGFDS